VQYWSYLGAQWPDGEHVDRRPPLACGGHRLKRSGMVRLALCCTAVGIVGACLAVGLLAAMRWQQALYSAQLETEATGTDSWIVRSLDGEWIQISSVRAERGVGARSSRGWPESDRGGQYPQRRRGPAARAQEVRQSGRRSGEQPQHYQQRVQRATPAAEAGEWRAVPLGMPSRHAHDVQSGATERIEKAVRRRRGLPQ